jgi:hypothetical protein
LVVLRIVYTCEFISLISAPYLLGFKFYHMCLCGIIHHPTSWIEKLVPSSMKRIVGLNGLNKLGNICEDEEHEVFHSWICKKLHIYDDGMAVELKAHPHSTSGCKVVAKLSFLVVCLWNRNAKHSFCLYYIFWDSRIFNHPIHCWISWHWR